MAYPLREHDPERVEEDMLIGTKKRINGVDKYWSGPDLGYQTKATFEKLLEEGYKGDPDYMALGGWQSHRANLGINKALNIASPVLEPVMSGVQSAYNLIPERSATRELIEGGARNLAWGLGKVQEGMTATSRAAGLHPFIGNTVIEQGIDAALPMLPLGILGAVKHGDSLNILKKTKVLSKGQQRLLKYLTPEALEEITDPGLKMMYEKAAKMLNTPGLSKRNAEVLLQTGPDSGLIKLLEDVDDPRLMDKVITSYFTRNPQYFSGGFNFNLDHLVPVASVAKLASKVKPAVFQEALALQLKKFGRKFGHDQEFSLIPRRTHAAKHTGTPEMGNLPADWKTKYLDGIIDSLPENASVEQVSDALSQLYDTSMTHTGRALSSKDFFSIREGVMESLPSNVRTVLGENFDITGRMSSVEDPLKWKLFLAHLRGAPDRVKSIMQEIAQVEQVDLKNIVIE